MKPEEHLIRIVRRHPKTSEHVNTFLSGRGIDLPDWPRWCFMPMAAWYAIVSETNQLEDIATLAALGTWRYSQGIFRIHPDLLDSLLNSTVFGDLPADVLKRLPEFCVYIETPGVKWFDVEMIGFFAHLEWDVNTQREELRLLLNTDDDKLIAIPIHIGQWTVEESIRRYVAVAAEHSTPEVTEIIKSDEYIEVITDLSSRLISVLLYLCSNEPEIDSDRAPGKSFYRPQPTKTKKGLKLFPAEKPHVYTVGNEIGEKLRVQRLASGSSGSNRTVRTHIRRGHWHGFWTGPRTGERKFVYRWLPPTIVGK